MGGLFRLAQGRSDRRFGDGGQRLRGIVAVAVQFHAPHAVRAGFDLERIERGRVSERDAGEAFPAGPGVGEHLAATEQWSDKECQKNGEFHNRLCLFSSTGP